LVDLFKDSTRRESMGTAGRQKVENEYSWENEQHSLLEIYDRLASQ